MTMTSYRDVVAKAAQQFPIWGPNSGGGALVILAEGVIYEVVYGDESRQPGGAEEIRRSFTPEAYALSFATDPAHARMIAHLREAGLVSG